MMSNAFLSDVISGPLSGSSIGPKSAFGAAESIYLRLFCSNPPKGFEKFFKDKKDAKKQEQSKSEQRLRSQLHNT